MKRIYTYLYALIFTTCSMMALAQPANNDCLNAIEITDPTDWCSDPAEYTCIDATPQTTGLIPDDCFNGDYRDVWFKYTAVAPSAQITINGAIGGTGATLVKPEVSLYYGDCTNTMELFECASDYIGEGFVNAYQSGLFPGETYYIRVQGVNNASGTFQLCIQNYFPPALPSSDCPTGAVLCDKSPFVIQSATGAGTDNQEMNDAPCFATGINVNPESNSSWFMWTCDQSGTLTFMLTPTVPVDDIDFILYELPNGVGNCTDRQVLRCEASGPTPGTFPTGGCFGPTGLSTNANDISENAGCQEGQDNFVSAINMVSGKSYALGINNFTTEGHGIKVEFGGTGTFLGPTADFFDDEQDDTLCIGQTITFTDNSSYSLGSIVGWEWSFGNDASLSPQNTQGPHTVTFDEVGLKTIAMNVEANLGCIVYKIKKIFVNELMADTTLVQPSCGGGSDGSITLTMSNGNAPYVYNWAGAVPDVNPLTNLPNGNYVVTVTDAEGCYNDFEIDLYERVLVKAGDDNVFNPRCFGTSDGSIQVDIVSGAPPYNYTWTNGLPNSPNVLNLAEGIYTVTVVDNELCMGVFMYNLDDPKALSLTIEGSDASCFGSNDGTALATVEGGVGGYQYAWTSGGAGNFVTNLPAPFTYTLTVTDANDCEINEDIFIDEPGELLLDTISTQANVCYGDSGGVATTSVMGGVPPFSYSWDGANFQMDSILTGVPSGIIPLIIEDAEGCRDTFEVEILQPEKIIVDAGPDVTIDLGFSTTLEAVVLNPPGAQVSYSWTPAETLLSPDMPITLARPPRTTTYTVEVVDSSQCRALDSVTVKVIKNRPVYVPNTFTPNDDGINDFFTLFSNVAADGIKVLRIFDRWGELVFEGENLTLGNDVEGWNGTLRGQKLQAGVFAYYAIVKFYDGEELLYEGDVMLVR